MSKVNVDYNYRVNSGFSFEAVLLDEDWLKENLSAVIFGSYVFFLIFNALAPLALNVLLKEFCTFLPKSVAKIPTELPHPNPHGKAVPFGQDLNTATKEQKKAFADFRKLPANASDDDIAAEAVKYKMELFDNKNHIYCDLHFGKGQRIAYPFNPPHWNGFRGFYAELSTVCRNAVTGYAAGSLQHLVCGFLLPWHYLTTGNKVSFYLGMIGDLGFNFADLTSYFWALVNNKPFGALFNFPRPLFKLMIIHHLAAAMLELTALYIAKSPEAHSLACIMIISMLGTTGTLLILTPMMHLTPLKSYPLLMLVNQVIVAWAMILFRGIVWIWLSFETVRLCYKDGGVYVAVVACMAVVLFTLFNIDLGKTNLRLVPKLYKAWRYPPNINIKYN